MPASFSAALGQGWIAQSTIGMAGRREPGAEGGPTKNQSFQCAVCLEEDLPGPPVVMPCCGREAAASTTQFCRRCVEIICEQNSVAVGMCPRCRSYYHIEEDGTLALSDNMGQCQFCRQHRTLMTTRPVPLCSACLMGTRVALRYQCQGCGRNQRIPHPMWRYQPTPGEHTTDTWACHQACGDQTRW